MSALTDLFTSMANKIRSKVGGSQTYTPLQMVSAIDDVYDAGAASVPSPSSITPSNASPVSLTADNAVKPTTSGYAIASYSSVTPSDASPVTLASGTIYKMGGNGKAVANVNSITPSASAPSMSSGSIYKAGGSGYAIDTYSSITPSTSGTYFASGFRKMTSSGYAYSEKPKFKVGTFTPQASQFSVTGIGFKPKYLAIYVAKTTASNPGIAYIYNEDFSTTQYLYGPSDNYLKINTVGGSTSNYLLYSIGNDGFTLNAFANSAWRGTGYYFALG